MNKVKQYELAQLWSSIYALGFLALAAAQIPLVPYYRFAWNNPESYYTHGPIVPALSVIMIWFSLDALRHVRKVGSPAGILLLIAGIPLHIVGLIFGWEPLCGIAFFCFIFGLILLYWGQGTMRVLLHPILLLSTAMPIGAMLITRLTGHLQALSTVIAAKALFFGGEEVIIHGGNIITSDALPGPLIVGTPCSGLKLLLALVMVTWFVAYMVESSNWKRIFLVSLSLPLSTLMNSVRVAMIGYVGMQTDSVEAMHKFHDYSGYLSLLLCAVVVYGLAWLMGMRRVRAFTAPVLPVSHSPSRRMRIMRRCGVLASVFILSIVAVASVGMNIIHPSPDISMLKIGVPQTVGDWFGTDMEIDSSTQEKLPNAILISRGYVYEPDPSQQVHVFMETAHDRSMMHDPYVCLPMSGSSIDGETTMELSLLGISPRQVPVQLLELSGDNQDALMLSWYDIDGVAVPGRKNVEQIYNSYRRDSLKRVLRSPLSIWDVASDLRNHKMAWYRFTIANDDPESLEILVDFVQQFMLEGERLYQQPQ